MIVATSIGDTDMASLLLVVGSAGPDESPSCSITSRAMTRRPPSTDAGSHGKFLNSFREAALRAVWLTACMGLVSGAAGAADLPAPPATGHFTLGMSIEDALRATPDLSWEKTVSPVTGRTLEIRARDAFTLDGYSYTVRLRPQAHRWATLELRGRQENTDRQTCRRQVLALAAQLEPHFPNMGVRFAAIPPAAPSAGTIVAQTSPEGLVTVTSQPNMSPENRSFQKSFVTVGASARVLETIVNEERATWEFEQANSDSSPYAVRAFAHFDELALRPDAGLNDEPSPTCVIEASLHARPRGRPDFDTLNLAKVKPVALPSRELLHDTLAGIDLPQGGLTLPFRCHVVRHKGTLEQCYPAGEPGAMPFELKLAAQARLTAYRFNPVQLDPDSDVPLHAEMEVRLSPKDRDPKRAAAAGPIPIWRKTASFSELSREYPADALRRDVEALVTATCRIKPDLSLDCLSFETDPPGLAEFHRPAARVLSYYRAAPRLRNDQPAAGAMVTVRIRFQIEE